MAAGLARRARAPDLPWNQDLRIRGAAAVRGVPPAGPDEPVEITLPPGANRVRVPRLHVRRAELATRHVLRHDRMWVTSPELTAVTLAAAPCLEDAVVAVDQLVGAGGADLAEVRWLAGAALGPGCRRARRACALADGLAGSPQETRLRLMIGRSGLPVPIAQFQVLDGGRFVARVDVGWPRQRLALEYDRLWHAEPAQFAPRPGAAQPVAGGRLAGGLRDRRRPAPPGAAPRPPDRRAG